MRSSSFVGRIMKQNLGWVPDFEQLNRLYIEFDAVQRPGRSRLPPGIIRSRCRALYVAMHHGIEFKVLRLVWGLKSISYSGIFQRLGMHGVRRRSANFSLRFRIDVSIISNIIKLDLPKLAMSFLHISALLQRRLMR